MEPVPGPLDDKMSCTRRNVSDLLILAEFVGFKNRQPTESMPNEAAEAAVHGGGE
jgi:hypothetical protein